MNKTDLVRVVKETVSETLEGVTAKDTAVFVDATIKAIQDAVVNGDKVQIVGFGTFETTTRAARVGRNPQTGENISIPEVYSLVFGNEATGLPSDFHQYGQSVFIKHLNTIDSLNLTNAVSIGLYQFTLGKI